MILTKAHLSFEKDGKHCDVYLDNDATLEVAKDFYFQFGRALAQIEDNIKAMQAAQKEAVDAAEKAKEEEAKKVELEKLPEVVD
jgi:hypothetical protein